MKSNEEFIAGIYEKAAAYTEEKETKIIPITWTARATRIAAMIAVCIGLAGVGSFMMDNGSVGAPGTMPTDEDYGIALSSELGRMAGCFVALCGFRRKDDGKFRYQGR